MVKSLRLQTERQYLVSERDAEFNDYGIAGRSRAMTEVIRRAELVARTQSTVLITGDTCAAAPRQTVLARIAAIDKHP